MIEKGQDTTELDDDESNDFAILLANHPGYEKGTLSFKDLVDPSSLLEAKLDIKKEEGGHKIEISEVHQEQKVTE